MVNGIWLKLNHQPLPDTEMKGWLEIQRREICVTGSNMPPYKYISIGTVYGCLLVPIVVYLNKVRSLMARFMWPTWGPSGADRTQVGPMLAPWTLLYGVAFTQGQFHWKYWRHQWVKCIWKCKLHIWSYNHISQGSMNENSNLYFHGLDQVRCKWQWSYNSLALNYQFDIREIIFSEKFTFW